MKKGFTLIEMAIVFAIIGVIFTMGFGLIKSLNESKEALELNSQAMLAVQEVINFAIERGRLPTDSEFNPYKIKYTYDDNLVADNFTKKESICFVYNITEEQAFTIFTKSDNPNIAEVIKNVPLYELKGLMGCSYSLGEFEIITTMLPKAYGSNSYNAFIIANGGTTFDNDEYLWCAEIESLWLVKDSLIEKTTPKNVFTSKTSCDFETEWKKSKNINIMADFVNEFSQNVILKVFAKDKHDRLKTQTFVITIDSL